MSSDFLALLRAELGDAVATDGTARDAARADKSGHVARDRPLAVVTARDVADVQVTLRLANAHGVPVVPRGAGTGLAGGAVGGAGEIVLSTLAMNRVLELSVADEVAVVEPGVINGDFNDALRAHGLWFAPDPASRAISTIGGNIATNAGGLHCVKYGVTREAVLGLRVVLADGRLLELGHRTVKGVTGYDLTALMIGSEGTLGVIVGATVRLSPLPRGTAATLSVAFDTVEQAARAASAIVAGGVGPAALELLDGRSLGFIAAYAGTTPTADGAQLLLQTDGAEAAADAARALEIVTALGGRGVLAADPAEGERLFALRRAFHPALERQGTVLIEDVAVPRSRLGEMFAAIGRIEQEHGLAIPTVAHAGDGNLHPNFLLDGPLDDVPDRVWDAADALFRAALELGGTLTGEHGVGLLKRRWIARELGEDVMALHRDLKRVFDPNGILNPGKML